MPVWCLSLEPDALKICLYSLWQSLMGLPHRWLFFRWLSEGALQRIVYVQKIAENKIPLVSYL